MNLTYYVGAIWFLFLIGPMYLIGVWFGEDHNAQCSSALLTFYKKNVIIRHVFLVSIINYVNRLIMGSLLRRDIACKPHTLLSSNVGFFGGPSSSLNAYQSVEV